MKHILTLNEYRNQLQIPFDGKHPLHDKDAHIHIIDSLLHMGYMVDDVSKYSPSRTHINSFITDDVEDEAMRRYIHETDRLTPVATDLFYYIYPPDENPEYYIDEDIKYLDPENITLDLTPEGIDVLEKDILPRAYEEERKTDIEGQLQDNQDEHGLINIWRAIEYHRNDKYKDEFEFATDYKGVGIYWTYNEENAQPYWNQGDGKLFILHGKVKPEDINYEETVFKSVYDLKDEEEVVIKSGEYVLIYKITDYKSGKEVNLEKPIVVPV